MAYYLVKKGDKLWDIVKHYAVDDALGMSTLAACKVVSSANGIPYNPATNVAYLAIGQQINLTTSFLKKPTTPTPTTASLSAATVTTFGPQAVGDSEMLALWTWSKHSETKHYIVQWSYRIKGIATWFAGHDEEITTTNEYYMFTAPRNAFEVRFRVKPVTSKKATGSTTLAKWTAEWTKYWKYSFDSNPPDKPGAPSITISDNVLSTRIENIPTDVYTVEFQVVEDDKRVFKSATGKSTTEVDVLYRTATYQCPVNTGHTYKVRCRYGKEDSSIFSEWSDYSGNSGTKPKTPGGITTCKAESESSVHLKWSSVSGTGITYDIEYSTKKEYFDITGETQKVEGINSNEWIVTGLESGQEYFFRVRANQSGNASGWTSIKSVIIGTTPSAPTTWSSTTTAIVGEGLVLYWIHNSEDASSQTAAQLELSFYVGDNRISNETVTVNTANQEDDQKTKSYAVSTSGYSEGSTLIWRARTAGVTGVYGDWSVSRNVDIYARPTIGITMLDHNGDDVSVVRSFPVHLMGTTGPSTQTAMGFHVSVETAESYESTDIMGNPVNVRAGDEIFSEYINSSTLDMWLSANNIDLESDITYTIKVVASMNSGLTAETHMDFIVIWEDERHTPGAEVGIDYETLSAYIRPYCEEGEYVSEEISTTLAGFVSDISGDVASNDTVIYDVQILASEQYTTIESIDGVDTQVTVSPGDAVYAKRFYGPEQILTEYENGGFGLKVNTEYYVEYVKNTLVSTHLEGVTLAVYRREFDGQFTEIARDIDGTTNTFVTDPHPSLDFARYRIVATTVSTGAVSYMDIPAVPVSESAVVIQWDEDWTSFNINDDDFPSQPPWAGSMLKLPYNIEVSDSYSPDYSLVPYAGRKHPVSYHGTQIGSTATWNVAIDRNDIETLYALRRLAVWMGNAYVREPSGSGYWAKVVISFNQKYSDLTIPVTLNISRVEGGV